MTEDIVPLTSADPPLTIYTERLRARREELSAQRARDRHFANLRLAIFAAGAIVATGSLATGDLSLLWTLPFIVAFLVVVVRHDSVLREVERLQRAVEFYERGTARVDDRWMGRGRSGQRFRDPHHPYAEDLDIFGRGSLYERLCTARTSIGEEQLARWLLSPAAPEVARNRQEAVADLRDRLDLREELDLLAEVVQRKAVATTLRDWSRHPVKQIPAADRIVFAVLGVAGGLTAAYWLLFQDYLPFVIAVLVGRFALARHRATVKDATKGLDTATVELSALEPALDQLHRLKFHAAVLRSLQSASASEGTPAADAIRRLHALESYLHMRGNVLTAILMEVFLVGPQIAARVAQWRQEFGPRVPAWMDAVGEFEALNALASYAFENPQDVNPLLHDAGPSFDAEGLSHPLLPGAIAVANDVRLDKQRRLYVVSGSNMSGKSTLLRAIGVNVVLALAGAPVRARSLTLSPLQVGASIRTQDSLQEGVSRFYAEIQRLQTIVQLAAAQPPVLFLLDEILHGTNSHDRRIGAEAVVRVLLRRGAIGLLTTHDLALARIAEDPETYAVNVHFQDELTNGKMSFDYRLRPGVVEKSNALELMRAVGLDV